MKIIILSLSYKLGTWIIARYCILIVVRYSLVVTFQPASMVILSPSPVLTMRIQLAKIPTFLPRLSIMKLNIVSIVIHVVIWASNIIIFSCCVHENKHSHEVENVHCKMESWNPHLLERFNKKLGSYICQKKHKIPLEFCVWWKKILWTIVVFLIVIWCHTL